MLQEDLKERIISLESTVEIKPLKGAEKTVLVLTIDGQLKGEFSTYTEAAQHIERLANE